jgi:hypothetical protein
MKRPLAMVVIAGLIAAACASTFSFRRQELFEQSAKRYGNLIRWSEFEAAKAFLAPDAPESLRTVPATVRVSDYQVKQIAHSEESRKVVQAVEISYFKVDAPRVRTLVDRQLWEFDPDKEAWLLKSGFPSFQ